MSISARHHLWGSRTRTMARRLLGLGSVVASLCLGAAASAPAHAAQIPSPRAACTPSPSPSPPPAPVAIRVNSGGGAVTDGGVPWLADQFYRGGRTAQTKDPVRSATPKVDSNGRWSAQGYEIPVPRKGTYRVRLHLTEIYFQAPGKRVFDVNVEGEVTARRIDIFAVVGADKTYLLDTPVEIEDGGGTITFKAHVNHPDVSGIEVLSATTRKP